MLLVHDDVSPLSDETITEAISSPRVLRIIGWPTFEFQNTRNRSHVKGSA